MQCVKGYFRDIRDDILTIQEDPHAQNRDRIVSVALKITAVVLALGTAAIFLAGLGVIAGSPGLAFGLLTTTLALAVITHDLAVTGDNFHRESKGFLTFIPNDLRNRNQPSARYVNHTWIFKPIYLLSLSAFRS